MEPMGWEGELSLGYKLVPWLSWDQWNFVRESIFSSSDAVIASQQRISAWRSKGCLPVPIDVTAAIVEIQQKDPFFRRDLKSGAVESDQMLSMLYSMAIIRLVNCFVAHKKTKFSISELADAVGIPRVLVDIRHESSHRDLPSLQLVRHASVKALDWLKNNYWQPQKNAIPDVRKEIRSRLLEMTCYLKTNYAHASSGVKRKRLIGSGMLMAGNKLSSQISMMLLSSRSNSLAKLVSKIVKIIARLYSSYPSEVVSVLLEFFQLQTPGFCEGIDVNNCSKSDVAGPGPTSSIDELKYIVAKLSSKRPRLLLSLLRSVLETIEVRFTKSQNGELHYLLENEAEMHYLNNQCSLVHWLMLNLKLLKDSGLIEIIDEAQVLPMKESNAPKFSLKKLLHKCLTLSILSDKQQLIDSALLLVEIMRDGTALKERLKKLALLMSSKDPDPDHMESLPTNPDSESMLLREEDAVKDASEKLAAIIKSKRKLGNKRMIDPGVSDSDTNNAWTVAKSWIACPIGMLPCSFSSTPVLPVLDKLENAFKTDAELLDEDKNLDLCVATDDCHTEPLDHVNTPAKRLKPSLPLVSKCIHSHEEETCSPLEGRLLMNGIWRKVSEEELRLVESNIRSFC